MRQTSIDELLELVGIQRPAWMLLASCREHDTTTFFPAQGQAITTAVSICNTCPVRNDCLEYALATYQKSGIWGGVPERHRRLLRRERRAERDAETS